MKVIIEPGGVKTNLSMLFKVMSYGNLVRKSALEIEEHILPKMQMSGYNNMLLIIQSLFLM